MTHYLGRYSPTGTEPVMGVGDDDTICNRPCSFTIGSKIEENKHKNRGTCTPLIFYNCNNSSRNNTDFKG